MDGAATQLASMFINTAESIAALRHFFWSPSLRTAVSFKKLFCLSLCWVKQRNEMSQSTFKL